MGASGAAVMLRLGRHRAVAGRRARRLQGVYHAFDARQPLALSLERVVDPAKPDTTATVAVTPTMTMATTTAIHSTDITFS